MSAPSIAGEAAPDASCQRDATGRRLNGLSIDVEDYYQVSAFAGVVAREDWPRWPSRVEQNTQRTLEMLAEAKVHGTFFVLGCVARRYPGLVRAIVGQGHEIASHGSEHRRIWEQSPRDFAQDVGDAKKCLEDAGGKRVIGYRAPSFSIDRRTWWAFEVLAEIGYRYSSSINPIRHDHYGMHDAPRGPFSPLGGITEIPVGAVEIAGMRLPCGGGGYFRLFPYKLSRWCIRRVNEAESRGVVFYFHPWEIDPGQPRITDAPIRSRFRHYVNLEAMEGKLRRLMRDFAWGRLDTIFFSEIREHGTASGRLQEVMGEGPRRAAVG
jgi:polysaccharide deacetylase family protein (PEP-CTERM system associated)